MKQYLDLVKKVIAESDARGNRTGDDAFTLFGEHLEFDLQEGFPLVTTRKIHLKSVIHELLWFLTGSTNANDLRKEGVTIWDEWAVSDAIPLTYNQLADEIAKVAPGPVIYKDAKTIMPHHREYINLMKIAGAVEQVYGVKIPRGYTRPKELCGKLTHYERAINFILEREHETINPFRIKQNKMELNEFYNAELLNPPSEAIQLQKYIFDRVGIPTHSGFDGLLGPIYGNQWRSWKGKSGVEHDQIANVIKSLKERPFSRRHIVSAWNVDDLPDETLSPQENVAIGKMALAPCHCLFQFYVRRMSYASQLVMLNNKLEGEEKARLDAGEFTSDEIDAKLKQMPQFFLDCQLYQR